MVLPDYKITELAIERGMIQPFEPSLLNPASYDVTLADDYMLGGETFKFSEFSSENSEFPSGIYTMEPGEFILCHSQQVFDLPLDVVAQFALKSSRAREGYSHNMAGFCDPGWHGTLTMELVNVSRHELPLFRGFKMGQMVFSRMEGRALRPYNGKYQHVKTVSGSRCNGD